MVGFIIGRLFYPSENKRHQKEIINLKKPAIHIESNELLSLMLSFYPSAQKGIFEN